MIADAVPTVPALPTIASTTSHARASSTVTGLVTREPPNFSVAAATSATTVSATGPSSGPTATSTRRDPERAERLVGQPHRVRAHQSCTVPSLSRLNGRYAAWYGNCAAASSS